ncbi:unnamed protein product [Caenorhabditis brenneri]
MQIQFLLTVSVHAIWFGLPLLSITIGWKILGSMDQNIMQGVFAIGDHILPPIYSADVFTWYGFEVVWACNGFITVIGTIFWIIFYILMILILMEPSINDL